MKSSKDNSRTALNGIFILCQSCANCGLQRPFEDFLRIVKIKSVLLLLFFFFVISSPKHKILGTRVYRLRLRLRISTLKLEIPLILGGTGQWFRACGGEVAPLVI